MKRPKYSEHNRPEDWDNFYDTRGENWKGRGGLYERICLMNLAGREQDEKFSLLDLTCGLGDGIREIRKFYSHCNLHGYDFSRIAIEKCRKNFPKCSFRCFDLYTDEFEQTFDVIFFFQTLEHLNRPRDILKKVLKATGDRLIVTVPYKNRIPDPQHIHTFNENSFDDFNPRPRVLVDGMRVYFIFSNKVI